MTNCRICFLALLQLSCLVFTVKMGSAQEAPENLELRYHFHEGQVVSFEETLKDSYRIQIGQAIDEPYSFQTSGKTMFIRSVDKNGTATADLQIDWVVFDMEENGSKVTFDSRTSDEPPAKLAGLMPILGRPKMRIDITPNGRVVKAVSLIGEGALDPETVDVLQKLPEESVNIGEQWKEDLFIELKGQDALVKKKVRLQEQFELKSIEDQIATIEFKRKVITPVNAPELQMQLMRRTPEGTFQIDLAAGQLLNFEFTQKNEVPNFAKGPSLMTFSQQHVLKMIPVNVAEAESATVK